MARKQPPNGLVQAARKHLHYPPKILDRKGGVLVCNKAAGLASAGRTIEDADCLQAHVMGHTRQMAWAVHQLDRDTSGVNFFVLRSNLVQPCVDALASGSKTYLAITQGAWPHGPITIDAAIGRVDGSPQVIESGRPARSDVNPLATTEQGSLLEVKIHTGRTHQVRLHLQHKGHPVLGDRRYGAGVEEAERHMLHAWKVSCRGDIEGDWSAPMPEDFLGMLQKLGIDPPAEPEVGLSL